MNSKLPTRKGVRLREFDYGKHGAYFITVCTQGRKPILSEITQDNVTGTGYTPNKTVGGDVLDAPQIKLSKFGEIAEKHLKQLSNFYDNISVEHYVIMPNHIHFILFVENIESVLNNIEMNENGASRTSPPTRPKQHSSVSSFVSTFKRFCNKEYGCNVWQRSFYDHIIRNQRDYDEVAKYICETPRGKFDKLYLHE